MKLYHGTSYSRLQDILSNGIEPRGKAAGNWRKYPSHPGMVYLSIAYPFYFSYISAEKEETPSLVFEIDIDELSSKNFYPDEDFVWQAHPEGKRPEHVLIRDNIGVWKNIWEKSLEHMGNICYRGRIGREYITRYCVVDFKKRPHLFMEVMDPTITILNYMVCGEKYRDLVSWFFKDIPTLPEIKTQQMHMDFFQDDEKMVEKCRKTIEFWEEQSKNRDGIEIFSI